MSFSFSASLVSIEFLGNHFIFHSNFGPLKNKRSVKIEYLHFALLHSSLKADVEVQNNCLNRKHFLTERMGSCSSHFPLLFCCFFFQWY